MSKSARTLGIARAPIGHDAASEPSLTAGSVLSAVATVGSQVDTCARLMAALSQKIAETQRLCYQASEDARRRDKRRRLSDSNR